VKRITVLFENSDCLVLNKPAGLAVQGGREVGASLDKILAAEWSPPPLLVHRLDKDCSGVILAAKNREAAARFSAALAGRNRSCPDGGVLKQYLALTAGCPRPEAGIIRLDLETRGKVRFSETRYRRRSGDGDFSLLELELGTGRMHQIRRHLASIGAPILGDDKYGDFVLNRGLRKTRGLRRLLLHARRLVIPPALAGFPLDVSAPLPDYFAPFIGDPGDLQLFFPLGNPTGFPEASHIDSFPPGKV
jgi:23S rRNA pseudouridine955/2504/2580 synthase